MGKKDNSIKRERRYFSHASADIRTSSWNPFRRSSAVLLDISEHGFKIELKGSKTLKPAQAFWLRIKLSSFDIKKPTYLESYVTAVWFDESSKTGGGVFSDLTKKQDDIIERILDYLKENQPDVLSSKFDPTEEFEESSSAEDDPEPKKRKKKNKKSSFEDDLDDVDLNDNEDDLLDD